MEKVEYREKIEWIQGDAEVLAALQLDDLLADTVIAAKKFRLDDETKFCDARLLAHVMALKTGFDRVPAREMRSARSRSNAYEAIGKSIFQNRAAVKMANLDAALDFMFTKPRDEHGRKLVRDNELLYFADVCAGPGGFSEYVLWRKKWMAKGFGFTLRGEHDFRLHEFVAGHPDTFDAHYGAKGDGNVYDPENIRSFSEHVLRQTGTGVHFMMADGGFGVAGQENIQEILSKRLYLSQCLVALSIVRENGHFVTKLFDLFTPFSVGLVYLMQLCFQQICIVKPNTSRPANSERYLVCRWKRANTDVVREFLAAMNQAMFDNEGSEDLLEIIPHSKLQRDEKFFAYMLKSNNRIASNQVIALTKVAAYCRDRKLREPRQAECKIRCSEMWRIPNERRQAQPVPMLGQLFKNLMGPWMEQREFMVSPEHALTGASKLADLFYNLPDWHCVPVDVDANAGRSVRTFFMSKGNHDVYQYTDGQAWQSVTEVGLELPPNTLLYGELARELAGEGRQQTAVYALHIIDGMWLGGVDIRNWPFLERLKLCETFAAALNKPCRMLAGRDADATRPVMSAPIRCKRSFPLAQLRAFFDQLSYFQLKDGRTRLGMPVRDPVDTGRFYVPRGILLFDSLKSNLRRLPQPDFQPNTFIDGAHHNRRFQLDELANPDLIYASFKTTFHRRLLWQWAVVTQIDERIDERERIADLLYRVDLEQCVNQLQ